MARYSLKRTRDQMAGLPFRVSLDSLQPGATVGGMKHVVQFSGGAGSWATARLVVDSAPSGDEVVLLFADVLIEDEETYAFLDAAASDLGVPITRLSQGKTPWDIFKQERYLGNSRLDPCSKLLKRLPLRRWVEENCEPESCVVYLGIDWTEAHRLDRARPRWEPWRVEAPLIATGMTKPDILAWAKRRGLPEQRLYKMGLAHANCGGGCVKAGMGHWAHLLKVFPERYAEWERHEEEMRSLLGDVSMLRDRSGGQVRPLPLKEFRRRIECGEQTDQLDLFDIGGCGCALE